MLVFCHISASQCQILIYFYASSLKIDNSVWAGKTSQNFLEILKWRWVVATVVVLILKGRWAPVFSSILLRKPHLGG